MSPSRAREPDSEKSELVKDDRGAIGDKTTVCRDEGDDPRGEKADIGDGRARVRGGAAAIVDGGLRSVMTLRSVI